MCSKHLMNKAQVILHMYVKTQLSLSQLFTKTTPIVHTPVGVIFIVCPQVAEAA